MQSNPFGIPFKDLFEARVLGEAYLLGQGCWFRFDQAACLRDKPVEDLLRGQAGRFLRLQLVNFGLDVILTWAPVVDGRLITEQPLAAALGGAITKPVLLGSNQDEGIIFFPADRSASLLEYNATLGVLFGQDNFRRILSRYPLEPDNRENTIRVATDFLLVCSSRAAASTFTISRTYRRSTCGAASIPAAPTEAVTATNSPSSSARRGAKRPLAPKRQGSPRRWGATGAASPEAGMTPMPGAARTTLSGPSSARRAAPSSWPFP
jgi:carboxylesterase type B